MHLKFFNKALFWMDKISRAEYLSSKMEEKAKEGYKERRSQIAIVERSEDKCNFSKHGSPTIFLHSGKKLLIEKFINH